MSITTFRMKLGDWISGGRWSAWNSDLIERNDSLNERNGSRVQRIIELRWALILIDRIETPKAANGVKKAARIAREALVADADSADDDRIKAAASNA